MSSRKRKTVDEIASSSSAPAKKIKNNKKGSKNVEDEKSKIDVSPLWEVYEVVADFEDIDKNLSKTVCNLLEEENSIPFLCRYRVNLIQGLEPQKMREIKDTIDELKLVETKIQNLLKTLDREKLLTEKVSNNIRSARSLNEIEHLSALYKPASGGSLYERAHKLGLEIPALDILNGSGNVKIEKFQNPKVAGLKTMKEVEDGVKDVISHLIAKNEDVMDEVRKLNEKFHVKVISSEKKSAKVEIDEKVKRKFENYFDFSCSSDRIKPHQILAINRGKSLDVLKVKLEINERVPTILENFTTKLFLRTGLKYPLREKMFKTSFTDSYKKKISTFIVSQTQSVLKRKAEKAAIDAFAVNLKNLLLTKPVKNQKILGIDPGFSSGCKLAMISETSQLLETNKVINLKYPEYAETIICDIMNNYNCSLISIGNGTACRETEKLISEIIRKHLKHVNYCIVSEQGASVYSCSEIAKKEFPNIEVQYLGAISIARRLQDPLCELVKIDPKSIGVGMYQHDLNQKVLQKTLDEIVSECVSFVGVDLNTASVSLLKHVAGLTERRAEAILKYREDKGTFKSRSDLMKVNSIGPKIFTQCSGFTRVFNSKNVLDSTNVHPESYDVAKLIIKEFGLKIEDVGTEKFTKSIQKIQSKMTIDEIAKKLDSERDSVQSTIEALSKTFLHDYRAEMKIEQVFKKEIADIKSLKSNQTVTGVVMNICDFGAFIDIGVNVNGLIHTSAMNNAKLKVSDKVECLILNVDEKNRRIGLKYLKSL